MICNIYNCLFWVSFGQIHILNGYLRWTKIFYMALLSLSLAREICDDSSQFLQLEAKGARRDRVRLRDGKRFQKARFQMVLGYKKKMGSKTLQTPVRKGTFSFWPSFFMPKNAKRLDIVPRSQPTKRRPHRKRNSRAFCGFEGKSALIVVDMQTPGRRMFFFFFKDVFFRFLDSF